jgi:hypothetical protein
LEPWQHTCRRVSQAASPPPEVGRGHAMEVTRSALDELADALPDLHASKICASPTDPA